MSKDIEDWVHQNSMERFEAQKVKAAQQGNQELLKANQIERNKLNLMYEQLELMKRQNENLENDNKLLKVQSWITTGINVFLAIVTGVSLLASIIGS